MKKILSFLKQYKVCSLIVIPICIALFLLFPNKKVESAYIEEIIQEEPKITEKEKIEPTIEWLYVDIKGYVQNPGVYQLEKGKRVVDAIEISGGITEQADTSNINLGKKLQDEMVIVVSSKEDIKKQQENQNKNVQLPNDSVITNDQPVEGNVIITDDTVVGDEPILAKKLSLNNATMLQLQNLPGVGEAKALNIVEYRKQKPFEKIEDLLNVKGIGETLFEQIKDLITI